MVKKALLVVDVQNDFCPGGKLPVPNGNMVVEPLNKYIQLAIGRGYSIFASRDWHPRKSKHFREYGGKWPEHCIQGTAGADFHPELHLPPQAIILSKGMDPEHDGYTAFHGFAQNGKSFDQLLSERAIEELFVGGLATDYCVKSSVLDAIDRGKTVRLLTDAIRGVEVLPGDSEMAIAEMVNRGALPATLDELELEVLAESPQSSSW